MQTHENSEPITRIGGRIELEQAAKWTGYYRMRYPNETISHLFGNDIINEILSQPGCSGLRIYYSNSERPGFVQRLFIGLSNFFRKGLVNTVGTKHVIVVGVNSDGTDQLPAPVGQPAPDVQPLAAMSSSGAGNRAADMSSPCPGSSGCPKNKLTGDSN